MFLKARADLEARQEEALANAWAVLESSMASMRSPVDENTCSQQSVEAEQHTPAVNALVDAASEQSMQSPNGFGGAQLPSVFLTPATGANPVYLNGGNYYTPELFSPVDVVYYTAPNTRVPVSARLAEQTPSFERSGADSG